MHMPKPCAEPRSCLHSLQEDRYGLLQLSQPDLGTLLQLLLSAQLALRSFAQRAAPPAAPAGPAARAWAGVARALRRRLGFAAAEASPGVLGL